MWDNKSPGRGNQAAAGENNKMKIWSLRFSAAQGNHWVMERECTDETIQGWLAVFRADEPNVCFIGHMRKPSK